MLDDDRGAQLPEDVPGRSERGAQASGRESCVASKTTTGVDIQLDGYLLAILEALFHEVTAKVLDGGSFSSLDEPRDMNHLVSQLSDEELRAYLVESIFLNQVKYRERPARELHEEAVEDGAQSLASGTMSENYLATRFTWSRPHSIAVMLCDGRIVCGCADPYAKRVLGDVRTATVAEIWTGPTASQLREDLEHRRLVVLRGLPAQAAACCDASSGVRWSSTRIPGLSTMNCFSCFATSVPSAPSADPEKVSTVSLLSRVRAQASPAMARSKRQRAANKPPS